MKALIVKLIITVLVILFAIYVWPTPYRYGLFYKEYPLRIHRITGEVERWTPGGWRY